MSATGKASAPPTTAVVPLLYWLLVLLGLAGMTAAHLDRPSALPSVWVGSLLGVAFGQLLAWCRLRVWLAVIAFVGVLSAAGWATTSLRLSADWLVAFAPATLGGYFCLTDRGALLAFWYPTALWMVALLDRPRASPLAAESAGLAAASLAVLFVAFLRTRETRRVALWRTRALVTLAEPVRAAVLRRAPMRVVSQHGWTLGMAGAALVATTLVAPHLWRTEAANDSPKGHPPGGSGAATSGSDGATCCPEAPTHAPSARHVSEYFSFVHAHDAPAAPTTWPRCVPCQDGAPLASTTGDTTGATASLANASSTRTALAESGSGGAAAASSPRFATRAGPPYGAETTAPRPPSPTSAPRPPSPTPAPRPPSPTAAPRPESPTAAPPTTAGAPALTPSALAPPVVPMATAPSPPPSRPTPTQVVAVVLEPAPAAPVPGPPWGWLIAAATASVGAHALSRVIRRQLTLRHLASPLWHEGVGQRVSNLWQLMLIGLRDAGWQSVPGEQPQDLARRVGIAGAETCATVLERARHGVRVEPADLRAMESAARNVYATARARAGFAARAAAAVRWPLC